MGERSFRENWSMLSGGQKLAVIGSAIWAMFRTAVGAAGDGNTSWRALGLLDDISKRQKEKNRIEKEFLDTMSSGIAELSKNKKDIE